jgi:hypothetical protein
VDAAAWLTVEQASKALSGKAEYKDETFEMILVKHKQSEEKLNSENSKEEFEQVTTTYQLGRLMDNRKEEQVVEESPKVMESMALGTIFVLAQWIASKVK